MHTYDQLGKMIRITYPDNNTTQKKYDELGRLIQTTDATAKWKSCAINDITRAGGTIKVRNTNGTYKNY